MDFFRSCSLASQFSGLTNTLIVIVLDLTSGKLPKLSSFPLKPCMKHSSSVRDILAFGLVVPSQGRLEAITSRCSQMSTSPKRVGIIISVSRL